MAFLLSLLLPGNPCSAQLCPQSGCPHPVIQLLLPSSPHISDLCLSPSLAPISPDLLSSQLLWHLFPPQQSCATVLLLMFTTIVLSPWQTHSNGGGRDIFNLLFCFSLFSWPLCLTMLSPFPEISLLCWCWCSVCLFPVPHPIHNMFSSAHLLEHTLLPMPVCLSSPTNPSK